MGATLFQGPFEEVGPENRGYFGPEMATSKNHVHKIIIVPVFIYDNWTYDYGGDSSIFRPLDLVGTKNLDFLGQNDTLFTCCHFRA
jgi:hypothetical protein